MLRQVTESVIINKIDERMLINSKNEWNYVRTQRLLPRCSELKTRVFPGLYYTG